MSFIDPLLHCVNPIELRGKGRISIKEAIDVVGKQLMLVANERTKLRGLVIDPMNFFMHSFDLMKFQCHLAIERCSPWFGTDIVV